VLFLMGQRKGGNLRRGKQGKGSVNPDGCTDTKDDVTPITPLGSVKRTIRVYVKVTKTKIQGLEC